MSLSRYDEPNGSYTSSIPPGTRAWRAYVDKKFSIERSEVVRDRSRCNAQGSEHCECGAVDHFPDRHASVDPKQGRAIFDWAVKVSNAAGVQSIIYDRRVIGFGNPTERRYGGAHDHKDHVHVGLNRWARANLTQEFLATIDPDEEDDEMKPADWQRLEAFVHKEVGMLAAALLDKDNEKAQAGGSHFDTPRGESLMDVSVAARNHARKAAENTATPPAPPAAPIDAEDPSPESPDDDG